MMAFFSQQWWELAIGVIGAALVLLAIAAFVMAGLVWMWAV
jgi:hypothetical protein